MSEEVSPYWNRNFLQRIRLQESPIVRKYCVFKSFSGAVCLLGTGQGIFGILGMPDMVASSAKEQARQAERLANMGTRTQSVGKIKMELPSPTILLWHTV